MNVYTLGWLALGIVTVGGFFLLELPAIRRKGPGLDTLTDHIKWLFALGRHKGSPYWILRRILFLYIFVGSPAVLVGHFVGWL